MGDGLDRREVLQGAAAAGVAGVAGVLGARSEGSQAAMAPALFVSHGSPMVALDSDAYPRALKSFGDNAGTARALVVVSAHWETPGEVRVTASARPPLIHDFSGFPEPLYRLRYDAPGDVALSSDVVARLKAAGLPAVADAERGLDHGTWVPLLHAFPQAKLPVVQVSMPLGASPAQVARLGEVLRPLRAQGVLLMGSGGLVHNLRRLSFHEKAAPVEPWAQAFDGWVKQKLEARDFSGLQQWLDAPNARLAHPRAEHLMPLYFVLGAALPEDRLTPVFEGFHHGTLSMRSFALRG